MLLSFGLAPGNSHYNFTYNSMRSKCTLIKMIWNEIQLQWRHEPQGRTSNWERNPLVQTLFNIVVEPCDCPNHSYQQKAELCHCLIFCHPQCIQHCCQVSEKLIIFRPHNPLKKWMQAQKNKKKKTRKRTGRVAKAGKAAKIVKKKIAFPQSSETCAGLLRFY